MPADPFDIVQTDQGPMEKWRADAIGMGAYSAWMEAKRADAASNEKSNAEPAIAAAGNDALAKQVDKLVATCDAIAERLDAYLSRQEQAAQRARDAAMARRVDEYMRALPDPDLPIASGDHAHEGGELVAHPPVDEERYAPEGENDGDEEIGSTGTLPPGLAAKAPAGGTATEPVTDPSELANPQLHEPQFRDPAAVSLW
jgi:hypothetical protein